MYIPKLVYYGQGIKSPDPARSWDIWNKLRRLEDPLAEAALALAWFEDEFYERQNGLVPTNVTKDNTSPAVADKKSEKCLTVILPESFRRITIFIHARTFLFSLDKFSRHLQVLKLALSGTVDIQEVCNIFTASVPDVRGVRNSIAHSEDRLRGIGRNGKTITPQPVSNPLVEAPTGGVFMHENLIGTKFGSTMDDGQYGEVDITIHSLRACETAIQSIIELLEWEGTPQYWPT